MDTIFKIEIKVLLYIRAKNIAVSSDNGRFRI